MGACGSSAADARVESELSVKSAESPEDTQDAEQKHESSPDKGQQQPSAAPDQKDESSHEPPPQQTEDESKQSTSTSSDTNTSSQIDNSEAGTSNGADEDVSPQADVEPKPAESTEDDPNEGGSPGAEEVKRSESAPQPAIADTPSKRQKKKKKKKKSRRSKEVVADEAESDNQAPAAASEKVAHVDGTDNSTDSNGSSSQSIQSVVAASSWDDSDDDEGQYDRNEAFDLTGIEFVDREDVSATKGFGGTKCTIGGHQFDGKFTHKLKCARCGYRVWRFPGRRWADDVDYFWVRNYALDDRAPTKMMEDLAKLQKKLEPSTTSAAYACGCTWQTVERSKDVVVDATEAAPHGGISEGRMRWKVDGAAV